MNWQDHIEQLPDVMLGKPVFKGTRVPIRSLFDHLKAGDGLEVFLDDFPGVSREHVEAVLDLAQRGLLNGVRAA